MQTIAAIELLQRIKKQDEEFQAGKSKTTAATFCCDCRANTFVGLKPFWHRFGRSLCDSCGRDYERMLKAIDAWDY